MVHDRHLQRLAEKDLLPARLLFSGRLRLRDAELQDDFAKPEFNYI
jgi:hypothetical protein